MYLPLSWPALIHYHALAVLVLVLSLLSPVLADTEIRNFRLPLPPSTRSIQSTRISDISSRDGLTTTFNVSSEDPERWLHFDLDQKFTSWTVRLSWPGSSPTRFDLEVLPSTDDIHVIVHVTAAQLSPRFPRHPFIDKGSHLAGTDNTFFTPVAITVEPLLMGVLPRTSLPALGWIIVFASGAAATVPRILRYLDQISRVEESSFTVNKDD